MSYSIYAGHLLRRRILVTVFLLSFSAVAPVSAMWDEMLADQIEEAEAGDADAQYEVGIKYLKGHGVEQDTSRAMHWLKLSAQSGNERAAGKLQHMQEQRNRFEATLKKATTGDAQAQYTVGMMFLKGKGTAQDGARARDWIGKSARQSNQKAITRLGILYLKGEGGDRDYAHALELFNSVSNDSVLAQYYLGEMYAAGKGVDRNFNTAIDWYRKAVDGGFKRAGGKIINMQEELRMASRRASNAQAEVSKAEPVAVAKPAQAAPAPVKAVKKAPVPKQTKKARKAKQTARVKKAPAAKRARLTPLEKLASMQWVRRNKPVDYLPSSVTLCEIEGKELVCFSKVLKRTQGAREVEYRVKSEISEVQGKLIIKYRNLVLDVVETEVDDDDQPLGYDDEVDQGFRIKTGWTQDHKVECSKPKRGTLDCLKDRTHKMNIVEARG